jgi:DNA adenine methylase
MKYMGSKNRIAKHILPIILKDRKEGQWYIEPFVGGFNLIDKVKGNRIAADCNPYITTLFTAIQRG